MIIPCWSQEDRNVVHWAPLLLGCCPFWACVLQCLLHSSCFSLWTDSAVPPNSGLHGALTGNVCFPNSNTSSVQSSFVVKIIGSRDNLPVLILLLSLSNYVTMSKVP